MVLPEAVARAADMNKITESILMRVGVCISSFSFSDIGHTNPLRTGIDLHEGYPVNETGQSPEFYRSTELLDLDANWLDPK